MTGKHESRTGAVLFAQHLDRTAEFYSVVLRLTEVNRGGREWTFRGVTVCDGHDPEGNVIQFRERAR